MSVIKSKINTNSTSFKDNYQKMLAKIEELNKKTKLDLKG